MSGFVQQPEINRLGAACPSCPADVDTIYVSRLKDLKRALSNEADVEHMVREAGVSVAYAQELSFEEQRALFAGDRTVIAPHGAGLANLVWAQRAERVSEVFPAAWFNDCYAPLEPQPRALTTTTSPPRLPEREGAPYRWIGSRRC